MYIELQCKSNFSFLEGASHPEELVDQALQLGLKGMALCDLNGVYGIVRGFSRARHHPEFKYIVGAELQVRGHPNLQLLATSRSSYAGLCRILTKAHRGKDKGDAHFLWSEVLSEASSATNTLDVSQNSWRDLLVLVRPSPGLDISTLKQIFSKHLYLLHTKYLDGLDRKRSWELKRLSSDFDIPVLATNDVRYHIKQRKILQDVLRSTKEGYPLGKCGYRLGCNAERYLKSPEQMRKLYRDWPETLDETLALGERVDFSLSELRYRYPSEWIPEGRTAFQYLEELVWVGAQQRYPNVSDKIRQQLQHELGLVKQLEFEHYFLTIYDIVEFARHRDILCQGRGAAANSAICYVLGITAIDPIQMDLLFERFLSVERGEPPDIDVDFEHERREEVLQYIYEKYGRDRAAMVSAVITYKRRSALREVAKAFGIDVGTLSAKKLEKNWPQLSSHFKDGENLKKHVDEISRELQGFPRHLSIHSGGFTLSADPIIDIVPVEPARMPGRTIIQWDKHDLDELGLLKIDILSLGMLSALKKCMDHVGIELHQIPHDDPATYEMIQNVDTVGTFQIESRAQMSMLGRLQPKNFYDLVVEVAIVRPGPIVGNMVHPYLKRRHGLEPVTYPHPLIEKVLGKTLGVPLFQEQVMKLAIELAGFTPGEADQLRRAIGAWRSSGSIEAIGQRLRQGFLGSGLSHEYADQFFQQIKGFAHYGFPESHAASFALLAYASCYLKCHYPAEFTASLMNSQPMGFYQNHTLVTEVKRQGVEVYPLDINKSQWDCEILSPRSLRIGYRVVKGLAEKSVEVLFHERQKKPFLNLFDFLERTHLPAEVYQRLAMAGSFGLFGLKPREALWQTLAVQLSKHALSKKGEQLDIFSTQASLNSSVDSSVSFQGLNELDQLQEEIQAFRLSTGEHPMGILRRQRQGMPDKTLSEVKRLSSGQKVKLAGLTIVRQRPPTANGVCFCTLEDETGFLDITFFPKTFQKYKEVFLNNAFIIVWGVLQKDRASVNVLVSRVQAVFSEAEAAPALEAHQYFY